VVSTQREDGLRKLLEEQGYRVPDADEDYSLVGTLVAALIIGIGIFALLWTCL
jgi:hypothetical protein